MNWFSLLTSVFALAKEIVKYLREVEQDKKERIKQVVEVKNAIRNARKSKDTAKIELAFNSLGITVDSPKSKQLPNK